jgi:pimeloyl-ACP methyl ester carboxylesterase
MSTAEIQFRHIRTNGIQLHTALAGPKAGKPVILLHGFPEAWFGWQAQIVALAKAGFRVIAPDQRGYNLSDKPNGIASYRLETLAADVLGLADVLGIERFCLAGHDFGAMVAWQLASSHPQRLKRLAIANVPHPAVMGKFLRSSPAQILKSWYAFFFQFPAVPEWVLKANHWHFLLAAMPARLSPAQQERYRAAWAQPGAITGMLHWYRANLRRLQSPLLSNTIQVPTLILWGKQDPHLSYEMVKPSLDLCVDGRLVPFADATHWVLQDRPGETSRLLVEHFSCEE